MTLKSLLILTSVLFLSACASFPCPGGVERTDWCGCEPPVQGDDC